MWVLISASFLISASDFTGGAGGDGGGEGGGAWLLSFHFYKENFTSQP